MYVPVNLGLESQEQVGIIIANWEKQDDITN